MMYLCYQDGRPHKYCSDFDELITLLREDSKHQITILVLENSMIDDEKAKVIASFIPGSNITGLYLNNNNIGDEGIAAIVTAIKDSNVSSLWIDYNNRVSAKGAETASHAICSSGETLTNLACGNIGYQSSFSTDAKKHVDQNRDLRQDLKISIHRLINGTATTAQKNNILAHPKVVKSLLIDQVGEDLYYPIGSAILGQEVCFNEDDKVMDFAMKHMCYSCDSGTSCDIDGLFIEGLFNEVMKTASLTGDVTTTMIW